MGLSWKDWNRSDVLYGVVAPLVVVLVIVGLSLVGSFLLRSGSMSGSAGIFIGIISEIEEMVVIVAVPLLLGLVWNRWAGGASGFLLGSIYAMWFQVKYGAFSSGTSPPHGYGFWSNLVGLGS